jgi:hypothetical protein
MNGPTLDELRIADEPGAWEALGFTLSDDRLTVGATRIRLLGRGGGEGICRWLLRDVDTTELDGLPTDRSTAPAPAPQAHANRAIAVDHVVVLTPDLDRTVAALQAVGLPLRRRLEPPDAPRPLRMAFLRAGEAVVEVVERADGAQRDVPAAFWGLVIVVEDLDTVARQAGDRLGAPRDAVQPGRRIATVRPEAGLSAAVAFMTPGRP